ncbi:diaminopimelate epimerase [soil metagenome]
MKNDELPEFVFRKYSGAGNTFLIINDLNSRIITKNDLTIELCSKPENTVIDGVIFVERSDYADFKMNYFNRDGTGNALCGNGLRCTAKFILDEKMSAEKCINIESVDKIYSSERITSEYYKIKLPPPQKIVTGIKLKVNFSGWWNDISCTYVDCGSPHIVIMLEEMKFISALEDINIDEWGKNVRMHRDLMPEGANVNFVYYSGGNHISTRVYERGVERETLASGTGSIASAIAASLKYNLNPPIEVLARSGKTLTVSFVNIKGSITELSLSGEAKLI